MFIKVLLLVIYVAMMVSIAAVTHKKAKNLNDFLLGGRKIGPWLSAFAYGTSYFSAVIFIGYAGKNGWNFGLSATWIGIGNAFIGALLPWLIMAKPARRMTQRLGADTMPEFFQRRYDSRFMKIASALIIFVFLVPYSASVYQGLGSLFEKVFGIPLIYVVLGMAAVTALYLVAGGYLATAYGDLIQGIIMLGGVGFMIFFLFKAMGGVSQSINKLAEFGEGMADMFASGAASPKDLISMVVLTSLGTWGLPQMVHKFYAIKDESAIKRGAVISTIFSLIVGGGAYLAGAFGRVVLNNQLPEATATTSSFDLIMPNVLFSTMPDALLGLIAVLVLSASMSTLASLVLTSASTLSMDLFRDVLFPKMSQKNVMLLMRALCIVFVLCSIAITLSSNAGITTLMSLSWGTVAGTCLGPFLLGLISKRTTKIGAIAGMLSGFITSLGLTAILGMAQTPFNGSCAMIASIAVTFIVSLLTPAPSKEKIAEVFGE